MKIKSTIPLNDYCLELFQKVQKGELNPTQAHSLLEERTKWLALYETTFEYKGKEGRWVYSSRRKNNNPDAVVVVPVLTGREPKLVLIKEYRVPLQDYELHFPAGLVDDDESV